MPDQAVHPDQDDDDSIEDETEQDEEAPSANYDITSYGADFDVFGLVRRLENGSIVVPVWQRSYIWSAAVASSFVESLLVGLPVPGVFLGVDPTSKAHYIIDGQQRLRTLEYFRNGKFPNGRDFKLRQVSPELEGATYESLSNENQRVFDDALIHATIVRQDQPPHDDTSMCEVFRRLNTGGRVVTPQEIRCAVYRGPLIDCLKRLNDDSAWRRVLGRHSPRLKDEEMILRFFAMWHSSDQYRKPMSEFLDVFTLQNQHAQNTWLDEMSTLFRTTIAAFADAKEKEAFRLGGSRSANAATLDSMMVGLARRMVDGSPPGREVVGAAHDALVADRTYVGLVTSRTSDETAVVGRLDAATTKFRDAE